MLATALRFKLIDVGPHEACAHPAGLERAVTSATQQGYFLRLLTSGQPFRDADAALSLFAAVTRAGRVRFVMRLDEKAAVDLPDECIVNYVDVCAAHSLTADLLFEVTEDSVPQWVTRIACRVEELRFYSNIQIRRVVPTRRRAYDPQIDRVAELSGSRLVLQRDGSVLLRKRNKTEVREVDIGNLGETDLLDLVCTRRFAP